MCSPPSPRPAPRPRSAGNCRCRRCRRRTAGRILPSLPSPCTGRNQLSDALLDGSPARISLPLDVLAHETALPQREGLIWCAELPRVWRDRDEDLLRRWLDHAASLGVTAALAGNLGHLPLLRGTGLTVLGDYGLNVFNGRSLAYLKDKGLASACVSFELRFAQIRDMPKVLPTEAIVYGRLPLMITENCLVQNAAGCRRDREGPAVPADGPCRSQQLLRDRTGAAFPLLPAFGHRTEIQNSRPLWLADRPDFRASGSGLCPAALHHGIPGGMR